MREPVAMEIMAIVHGRSEYQICSSMRSNLRLKHGIYARDKGRTSIQVTSVLDVLRSGPFRSFAAFTEEYPDVRRHKGGLQDFTLFLLMDVDDCTPALKQAYIRGEMFRGHWLAPTSSLSTATPTWRRPCGRRASPSPASRTTSGCFPPTTAGHGNGEGVPEAAGGLPFLQPERVHEALRGGCRKKPPAPLALRP